MPLPVSMTGFAGTTVATPIGQATIEIRAVNSRFLDLTLKIADDLRNFEPQIRERIGARLARGKVECRLSVQRAASAESTRLNQAAVAGLRRLGDEVRQALPQAAPLSVAAVLGWPGVLETPPLDADGLRASLLAALDDVLDRLQDSRAREGASIADALRGRCDGIEAIVEQLRRRLPELRAAVERKLAERLEQALGAPLAAAAALTREEVSERIRQEVTLYGLRADVDEELSRLATHVAEVRRVIDAGGAVGRRLDFLMQELNREANTLGSKATAIDLAQSAIELKLLIEQMREQIQNLE
ncbi:MAG: YicC family protein [Burkholderiales bacterium]|nr:MAG: YicC family protein [Burkholderiales bacterium]